MSARCGLSRADSERAMDAVFRTLGDVLAQGGRFQVRSFGVFQVKARAPRIARNPKTGAALPLPAAIAPVLRPSRALKERLNPNLTKKGVDETQ